jgi:hypothetical protein
MRTNYGVPHENFPYPPDKATSSLFRILFLNILYLLFTGSDTPSFTATDYSEHLNFHKEVFNNESGTDQCTCHVH